MVALELFPWTCRAKRKSSLLLVVLATRPALFWKLQLRICVGGESGVGRYLVRALERPLIRLRPTTPLEPFAKGILRVEPHEPRVSTTICRDVSRDVLLLATRIHTRRWHSRPRERIDCMH